MLRALKKWLPERPPEAVRASYIALLEAARNPFFFASLGVPDTIDGRFELILLHLFLLQYRLHEEKDAQEFMQYLGEEFILDMDNSLRELGVSDPGVPKRIRPMAKAYSGRLQSYTASLTDHEQLKAALARNLYGTVANGDTALLDKAACYVERMSVALAAVPTATLTGGHYRWPDAATV